MRVAEIQSLTELNNWRYVDADNITRGKTLKELSRPHRWQWGFEFLQRVENHWPTSPSSYHETDDSELKKSFCRYVAVNPGPQLPDVNQFSAWKKLTRTTVKSLHEAAGPKSNLPAEAAYYIKAENLLQQQAQLEVRVIPRRSQSSHLRPTSIQLQSSGVPGEAVSLYCDLYVFSHVFSPVLHHLLSKWNVDIYR